MLGILVTEVGERVNRVAGLGHAKLHIACPEMKVILDGQLDHSQTVKLMDQGLLLFEGILRTYHKPNLVEICAVIKCICNDQMTDVNRVEATEIQPNLHPYFAKNSETKLTASWEDRSKSSFRIVTSNWGSKVISNLAL